MRIDLPSLINKSFSICKDYELKAALPKELLTELLKKDMLDMLIYLANDTTGTSVNDVVFINKLMGTKFDILSIRDYQTRRGNKNDFAKRVPPCIMEVLRCEKESLGFSLSFYKDTREIYKMLKELAYHFVSLDGKVTDDEVEKVNAYTNTIINFILNEESLDYLSFDNISSTIKLDSAGNMIDNEGNKVEPSISSESNRVNVKMFEGITETPDETIEDLLNEINKLIGLVSVKTEVNNLVNLIRVQKMRIDRGLKVPTVGLHLVFTGNPGTGKTTIARQIAKIYKTLGLISHGHIVETSRSGLVAGYMGQTATKVEELVNDALGGVLFIDEAYTLIGGMNDEFGREAVDTLLKLMEDKRTEFAVIVAGYPRPMEDFLASNPGLKSRFNRTIVFDDYSAEELLKIFMKFCNDNQYKLSNEAYEKVKERLYNMCENKGEDFANARDVRNYFEEVVTNQANRIMTINNADNEAIITIEVEDL